MSRSRARARMAGVSRAAVSRGVPGSSALVAASCCRGGSRNACWCATSHTRPAPVLISSDELRLHSGIDHAHATTCTSSSPRHEHELRTHPFRASSEICEPATVRRLRCTREGCFAAA